MQRRKNKLIGSFIGLAIGDAMGAPIEFKQRGSFIPVTSYRSGGKFNLKAGSYTDDTAMALCLAQSLLKREGFDAIDQLNRYVEWWHKGYMACGDKAVGLGKTVMRSLLRYMRKKEPISDLKSEKFSGNGSLMRIAPICIYYANYLNKAVFLSALSSKTTHSSKIAVDSCKFLAYTLITLYNTNDKSIIFSEEHKKELLNFFSKEPLHPALNDIIESKYIAKEQKQIKSAGYAIDSLEASLWSFYHTNNFEDAILKAVNLGGDADTIGAITGQIAGAFYGADKIPYPLIKDGARLV